MTNNERYQESWHDDSIQLPRLLSELEAAGAFTSSVIDQLCLSMDLEQHHIYELIDRAQSKWDEVKQQTACF